MILTHAAAVHGLEISPEPVDLARVALKRLGLIGKGVERDRRPTTAELNRLFRCFDGNARLTLPMSRIVQFAVATAMRLDEICRVEWRDLDVDRRMLLIRDRKDPRNKTGNNQQIPLFAASGFDAWTLIMAQARHLGKAKGSIFPYNSRSVGTAFRRAWPPCSCGVVSLRRTYRLYEGRPGDRRCSGGLRTIGWAAVPDRPGFRPDGPICGRRRGAGMSRSRSGAFV